MFRIAKLCSVLMIALASLVSFGVARAQEGVTMIPTTGGQFVYKLSPDGKTIATAEIGALHNGEIVEAVLPLRLYDVESSTERAVLTGHLDYATDLAFTPDSTKLASFHSNGYVNLWDVQSASLIKTLPVVPGNARIAFLADGITLAVLQQTGIQLWNIDSGYMTAYLTTRYDSWGEYIETIGSGSIDWLVDLKVTGDLIVSLSIFGNITVWKPASGESAPLRVSSDENPFLYITRLSVNGDFMAYLHSEEEAYYVWNLATHSQIAVIPAPGAKLNPTISADGTHLAFAVDTTVYKLDLDSNTTTEIASLPQNSDLRAVGLTVQLTFTPDGKHLIYGGFANTLSFQNAIYVIDME